MRLLRQYGQPPWFWQLPATRVGLPSRTFPGPAEYSFQERLRWVALRCVRLTVFLFVVVRLSMTTVRNVVLNTTSCYQIFLRFHKIECYSDRVYDAGRGAVCTYPSLCFRDF